MALMCGRPVLVWIQTELFNKAAMKHGDEQTVLQTVGIKPMPASRAAYQLVEQLASKRHLIFAPFYSRAMWWIFRLFPALLYKGAEQTIKKYREIIREQLR